MKLKVNPEDFRVDEVLELELKERGNYSYFILEKHNWTTLKALQYIAKQLRVNVKRFAVAGQKDRRATVCFCLPDLGTDLILCTVERSEDTVPWLW